MSLLHHAKRAIPERAKSFIRQILRRRSTRQYQVPKHLAENHRSADDAGLAELRKSIVTNYHVGWRSREAYSDEAYERDLNDHLLNRCEGDRSLVVPWLDTLRPLRSMKILEIGCGTGSSTVALAEQGATVVGIDVDEGAILVAKDRCRVYGITADIHVMSAEQIKREFQGEAFDLVIFFACLEHMTVGERLAALSHGHVLKTGEEND